MIGGNRIGGINGAPLSMGKFKPGVATQEHKVSGVTSASALESATELVSDVVCDGTSATGATNTPIMLLLGLLGIGGLGALFYGTSETRDSPTKTNQVGGAHKRTARTDDADTDEDEGEDEDAPNSRDEGEGDTESLDGGDAVLGEAINGEGEGDEENDGEESANDTPTPTKSAIDVWAAQRRKTARRHVGRPATASRPRSRSLKHK